MVKIRDNSGFSLTEVLLAIGILAVAMTFIAGVYPVGLHFTTIATERTIAVVAADEAFAKIRCYAHGYLRDPANPANQAEFVADDINLSDLSADYQIDIADANMLYVRNYLGLFDRVRFDPNEFFGYPSRDSEDLTVLERAQIMQGAIDPNAFEQKQYYWSALGRRVVGTARTVQVTVFVSRKTGPTLKYHNPEYIGYFFSAMNPPATILPEINRPVPVKVLIGRDELDKANEFMVLDNPASASVSEHELITDGSSIVDDRSGRIYRVLQSRFIAPGEHSIILDRDFDRADLIDTREQYLLGSVWVVPAPSNGGRNPCIAVYQREIRF